MTYTNEETSFVVENYTTTEGEKNISDVSDEETSVEETDSNVAGNEGISTTVSEQATTHPTTITQQVTTTSQ